MSGDAWIIQVKQDGEIIDFMPLNLLNEFKVEGLKVIFTATPVTPPENVRLVGQPVKILSIKKA